MVRPAGIGGGRVEWMRLYLGGMEEGKRGPTNEHSDRPIAVRPKKMGRDRTVRMGNSSDIRGEPDRVCARGD